MAENGAVEVESKVEPVDAASDKIKRSIADVQKMFENLPPEEQRKIFEMGKSLEKTFASVAAGAGGNGNGATVATAGRPAVEVAPAEKSPEAPAQAAPPAPPAQAAPELPSREMPEGFAPIPEGVYTWTPEDSGGHPLWGLLGQGRKREGGAPGRLVLKLLKPAYALTRAGKKVLVPAGGRVMVALSDALEPLLQLAEVKDGKGQDLGCAVIWLRVCGAPRDVVGGGREYPYELGWEHVPDDRRRPRLYPRELFSKAG